MLLNMYCVFDEKAETFNLPMLVPNDALAIRALGGAVMAEDSMLYANPGDFKMYRMGTFNRVTGEIIPCERPEFMVSALSVKHDIVEKECSEHDLSQKEI